MLPHSTAPGGAAHGGCQKALSAHQLHLQQQLPRHRKSTQRGRVEGEVGSAYTALPAHTHTHTHTHRPLQPRGERRALGPRKSRQASCHRRARRAIMKEKYHLAVCSLTKCDFWGCRRGKGEEVSLVCKAKFAISEGR